MVISRFEVYRIRLDPALGAEIKKFRPCLVVSPNEMNRHIRTVIVAPMTTTKRNYPSRVDLHFKRKQGQIALDQLRAVDKTRLHRKLGKIDDLTAQKVLSVLEEMFAP